MATINIGGREYRLVFDMYAMEQAVDVFGSMDAFNDALSQEDGRNNISDTVNMLLVMVNSALDMDGLPPLSHKQIAHGLDLRRMAEASEAIRDAINEGNRHEHDGRGETSDGYLNEEEQKNG